MPRSLISKNLKMTNHEINLIFFHISRLQIKKQSVSTLECRTIILAECYMRFFQNLINWNQWKKCISPDWKLFLADCREKLFYGGRGSHPVPVLSSLSLFTFTKVVIREEGVPPQLSSLLLLVKSCGLRLLIKT